MSRMQTGASDLEKRKQEIIDIIDQKGFFFSEQKISLKEFEQLAQKLGKVKFWQDVKIDLSKFLRVTHPYKIDFHNDCEFSGYLGWYCIEQDSEEGANLLIDTNDLDMHLSVEEIRLLESVNIVAPPEKKPKPLMSVVHKKRKIYYVPWSLEKPKNPKCLSALKKFQNYLKEKELQKCISIVMQPGQFLIVNDARMLHGRKALKKESTRFLKRVWICFD